MEKQKRKFLLVGDTYDKLKILSVVQKRPKKFLVECLRCSSTFVSNGQQILKYPTGCPSCRKADRHAEFVQNLRRLNGTKFGDLEVLDFAGDKVLPCGTKEYLARCLCHKCGKETVTSYNRLKSGGATMCVECSRKNLQKGGKIVKDAAVAGSSVLSVQKRRLNINSATGYTGVSYHKKNKNYRAYIYFRRKQYNLGSYKKLEDAVKARKKAEEKIFGNFLAWYQENYPDRWKEIQVTQKNKDLTPKKKKAEKND